MNIARAIFTKFDLFEGFDSWRYEKTIGNAEWWNARLPVMEQFTIGSIEAMRANGHQVDWITSFRSECNDMAAETKKAIVKAGGSFVINDDDFWLENSALFGRLCLKYKDADYLLLAFCDSDDMWRSDLWRELDKYKLKDGQVFVTRNGYCYDIEANKLYQWKSEGCTSFHVYVIPKSALKNKAALQAYWMKWHFNHRHQKLASHATAVPLPDGIYCGTMSGMNTSKFHGNKHAENHIGREVNQGAMDAFGLRPPTMTPVNTEPWWNEKGQKYLSKTDDRKRPDEFKALAAECVGPVLELGSAFGSFVEYLPKRTHYTGVEISGDMVAEARRRYPKRTFLHADIREAVNIFHGGFKTAVALQVLEHFYHPEEIVAMLKKVAVDCLVFSVPREGFKPCHFRNDGHIAWWADEADIKKSFGQFGKIRFVPGAKNHICGVIEW